MAKTSWVNKKTNEPTRGVMKKSCNGQEEIQVTVFRK